MKQLFALSAIGRDRPGIVADLAELIYECDCNLEDSRMTILGSEFAVLLLLSGQGPDVERRLSAGCKRLEWEKRLTVFFRPLEGEAPPAEPAGRLLECVVTGVDKAGIVARIARTLADHGANVADLRSGLRPEPESGTPIYTLRIVMRLPPGVDERALRTQLERDAAALRVDLALGEPGSLPDDR
jgi:glycine cleavage system transcriptional repressor